MKWTGFDGETSFFLKNVYQFWNSGKNLSESSPCLPQIADLIVELNNLGGLVRTHTWSCSMDSSLDPFFVQRRIRNLRGIALRHIDLGAVSENVFSLAFTITCPEIDAAPCYISTQISNSANPTWEELDRDSFPNLSDIQASQCVFQLFLLRSNKEKPRRILLLEIDLRAVIRVGDNLEEVAADFPKNSIIFLLRSGVYVSPEKVPKDLKHPLLPLSRAIRKPYSVPSLRQIIKLEKDLAEVKERKRKIDADIRLTMNSWNRKSNLSRQIELLSARTRSFKGLLSELSHSNQDLKYMIKDLTCQNSTLSESSSLNLQHLADRRREIEHLQSDVTFSKQKLKTVHRKLHNRRCELICDLKSIYPIHRSASGRLFITGIWLPSVDQHTTCDDTTLSASLGYAVHLMTLLSRILDIPLRYPLQSYCSTSSVTDHITAKLIDRDREYPLYPKNRDRSRFQCGVFLFNLCVVQLRRNCQMDTTDFRKTLENIRNLMEDGFHSISFRIQSTLEIPVSNPAQETTAAFSPMENGTNSKANNNDVPATSTIFPVQSAPDFRRLKVTSMNSTSAVFVANESPSDIN